MTAKSEVQGLVDDYWKWMRDRTILKEIDKDWVEINTPILDRHNDGLQLYIRRVGDRYRISDDGYALTDLLHSGVNPNSAKRSEAINEILRSYNIGLNKGVLQADAAAEDFPSKKNDFILAMLEIGGLHSTAQGRTLGYFLEDVSEWLDSKKVRGTRHAKIEGRSGVSHRIDFLIPGKSFKEPFTAVQTLSNPDKQSLATKVIMPMTDVTKSRDARFVAVFNDNKIKDSVLRELTSITESSGAEVIPWSKRNEVAVEI